MGSPLIGKWIHSQKLWFVGVEPLEKAGFTFANNIKRNGLEHKPIGHDFISELLEHGDTWICLKTLEKK